jgi:predicted nuclease of predicted toxin-antitoxin system
LPLLLSANENIPAPAVTALRARGHDVWWGSESGPGWADTKVLELAQAQGRVLLTCDKDFGELVFKQRTPTAGVVLFRASRPSPEALGDFIARFVDAFGHAFPGHFTVVRDEPARVRIVPLPHHPPL